MKRFALQVGLVFGTLALAVLLWQLREAVLLFALSLATVATLRPAVDFLVARHVRRGLAIGATFAGVLLLAGAALVLLGLPLFHELRFGADELLRAYDSASGSQESLLRRVLIERWPASADLYRALGSQTPGSGAQAAFGVASQAGSLLGRALVVLVMSVYWLGNRDAFEHWGLSLLPPDVRVRARETWRAAKAGVGAYLRSQLAQSLAAVLILDLGFHALGMRFPTLPAVAGGLGRLVPVVGIPFAVLTAVVAGLADGSADAAGAGLLASATFILIAVVGARGFPLRRRNAILEIVAMVALADEFGIAGLIAAAPLAAAIRIFASRLLFSRQARAAADLADVGRRLASLRERIAQPDAAVSPDMVNVIDRLEALLGASRKLDARR
jgi:predicted PurR-regulated permease PerM